MLTTTMNIGDYLERIGYHGSREPTRETLRVLHRAHMLSVPFENLDIHLNHAIELSLPLLYDKVVHRRRGGFCYELNGLFGWLLERLGFTVTLLSARVFNGTQPGAEFDHLLLLVELDEPLIVDVGFGDSFQEPLRLSIREGIMQYDDAFRITASDTGKVLERLKKNIWEPQYVFSLTPHYLSEFSAMCHYQQTSPDSHFTQKTICSLATTEGRITLSGDRLIVTTGGQREEHEVADEQAYRRLLKDHFGIELGERAQYFKLMAARA